MLLQPWGTAHHHHCCCWWCPVAPCWRRRHRPPRRVSQRLARQQWSPSGDTAARPIHRRRCAHGARSGSHLAIPSRRAM